MSFEAAIQRVKEIIAPVNKFKIGITGEVPFSNRLNQSDHQKEGFRFIEQVAYGPNEKPIREWEVGLIDHFHLHSRCINNRSAGGTGNLIPSKEYSVYVVYC